MMRYLILDMDGVVNTCGASIGSVMPEKKELIYKIVRETGCFLVLSSSWRKYPLMSQRADQHFGFLMETPILDKELSNGLWTTPTRGQEIQAWMASRGWPLDERWVILDDDPSACVGILEEYAVQTDSHTGLTEELSQEIINKLNA